MEKNLPYNCIIVLPQWVKVRPHSTIKKSGLLRNNAEFGTQIIQANCCYVHAINEDTATGWFNYPEKHLIERCLSTSSTSNHSELLPSSDWMPSPWAPEVSLHGTSAGIADTTTKQKISHSMKTSLDRKVLINNWWWGEGKLSTQPASLEQRYCLTVASLG